MTPQQRVWTIVLVVTGVLLMAGGPLPGRALQAEGTTPAYLAVHGRLYQWSPGDAAIRPLTTCDLAGSRALTLVLSPAGTHLAMNVVPEDIFNEGYAPSPTGDLWLCDLRSGVITMLTNIQLLSQSISWRAVWSPDGAQVAWALALDDAADLFVHDLTQGVTTRLVARARLDYGCGVGPFPPEFDWGESGLIAVGYFINSSGVDPCLSEAVGVHVYDATGSLVADLPAGETGLYTGLEHIRWDASDPDRLIFYEPAAGRWQTVTLSGVVSPAFGSLQQYLPAADPGPTLTWEVNPQGFLIPRVVMPGMNLSMALEIHTLGQLNLSFSQDGTAALLRLDPLIYGIVDGEVTLLDLSALDRDLSESGRTSRGDDIAWASMRSRLTGEWPVGVTLCSNRERLYYESDQGRVISGLGANNLREFPLMNSTLIGEIPDGAVFSVQFYTNVCSQQIRWRYVTYEGVSGWTAESVTDTYYLEPAPG